MGQTDGRIAVSLNVPHVGDIITYTQFLNAHVSLPQQHHDRFSHFFDTPRTERQEKRRNRPHWQCLRKHWLTMVS